MGGPGLDRTGGFQKFCGSGLDLIQFLRIGLGSDRKISQYSHLCCPLSLQLHSHFQR